METIISDGLILYNFEHEFNFVEMLELQNGIKQQDGSQTLTYTTFVLVKTVFDN